MERRRSFPRRSAATSFRLRRGPTRSPPGAAKSGQAGRGAGDHARGARGPRARLVLEAGRQDRAGGDRPRLRSLRPHRRYRSVVVRRARRRGCRQPGAARSDLQRAVPAVGRSGDRARRRLVRDVAAQPGQGSRPPRHVRRLHRAACPRSPRSASTCSISPRSIRSAAPTARAATTRSPPARMTRAAPMRSGRRRAATTRSIPSSARSTISAASSPPCAAHGMEVALDFAIQCSPDHPWLHEHPEWFKSAAGRLDPLRREPAEEIRGHRQSGFLCPPTATPCGRRCATSCCSGSTRACASSASTIRTPSRFRSGNG